MTKEMIQMLLATQIESICKHRQYISNKFMQILIQISHLVEERNSRFRLEQNNQILKADISKKYLPEGWKRETKLRTD